MTPNFYVPHSMPHNILYLKQIDVLPSKNQALLKFTTIQCIVIIFNDVTCKSCEQRLITKEHIATYVYKFNSSV